MARKQAHKPAKINVTTFTPTRIRQTNAYVKFAGQKAKSRKKKRCNAQSRIFTIKKYKAERHLFTCSWYSFGAFADWKCLFILPPSLIVLPIFSLGFVSHLHCISLWFMSILATYCCFFCCTTKSAINPLCSCLKLVVETPDRQATPRWRRRAWFT